MIFFLEEARIFKMSKEWMCSPRFRLFSIKETVKVMKLTKPSEYSDNRICMSWPMSPSSGQKQMHQDLYVYLNVVLAGNEPISFYSDSNSILILAFQSLLSYVHYRRSMGKCNNYGKHMLTCLYFLTSLRQLMLLVGQEQRIFKTYYTAVSSFANGNMMSDFF